LAENAYLCRGRLAGRRPDAAAILSYIPCRRPESSPDKETFSEISEMDRILIKIAAWLTGVAALLTFPSCGNDGAFRINGKITDFGTGNLRLIYFDNGAVQNWGAVYTKSTTIYNAAGESASVSIVAAAKDSDLTRYVTFRTRKGHKAISFDSGSAILTEKTAENLGLHTGDTFWVENAEGTRVELTLTGITENYMFTRLYLPRAQLESLLGTAEIPWNTVYGQTTCTDAAGYNALRTDLLDCNYVSSISFTEDTTELFDNLIVSLGYVVVLIIICAAALAAVVLYNLISVNLEERKKELATIKVLGFYDQEVYRYIFREIELLALIGSGVGLALGVPLHKFIVLTVEMDQLMFIRTIAPRSYLLAVALTMVFTVVVCFVMRRHVRRISMVESMKAPE